MVCDKTPLTKAQTKLDGAIGTKAVARRPKEKNTGEEKVREKEGWKQLEETLFRRWELLGICYMKIGDKKVIRSPC